MLGKCLYEGMLLELPLAAFFLKKMRGGVCDINDMPSLDPEVYKHLLQLRHYTGGLVQATRVTTGVVEQLLTCRCGCKERDVTSSGWNRLVLGKLLCSRVCSAFQVPGHQGLQRGRAQVGNSSVNV